MNSVVRTRHLTGKQKIWWHSKAWVLHASKKQFSRSRHSFFKSSEKRFTWVYNSSDFWPNFFGRRNTTRNGLPVQNALLLPTYPFTILKPHRRDRRILCTSETAMDGFRGSEFVKVSVGSCSYCISCMHHCNRGKGGKQQQGQYAVILWWKEYTFIVVVCWMKY